MTQLIGSEKQIAWAEDIKAKFESNIAEFDSDVAAILESVDNESAKWWIENREAIGGEVLKSYLDSRENEIIKAVKNCKTEKEMLDIGSEKFIAYADLLEKLCIKGIISGKEMNNRHWDTQTKRDATRKESASNLSPECQMRKKSFAELLGRK